MGDSVILMLQDVNTSPTNIISGIGDTDELGPEYFREDESMAFPQEYADLGGPYNDSEDIVRAVRETVQRVRDKTAKWREKRRRCKNYYKNRYEQPEEADSWQSDKVNPRVYTTIEQFTAHITQMLERADDWNGMKSVNSKTAFFMDFMKEQLQKHFTSNRTNFQRFFSKFVKHSLKNGSAHGMPIFEVDSVARYSGTPKEDDSAFGKSLGVFGGGGMASLASADSKPNIPGAGKPRLKLELIPHDCITRDPETGGDIQAGGFKIWTQYVKAGYFKKIAPKHGYDMVAVERAMVMPPAGFEDLEHFVEEAEDTDMLYNMYETGQAKIQHYFGTLYDCSTHEILVDTKYFVVLNDREIIRQPSEIPFWEGEDPIVSAPIIEDDENKIEGRSPIIMALDQFQLLNEMQNLMEDFFVQNMIGMKQIDLDLLDDFDEDFEDGFFPGKVFYIRSGNKPGADAVKNIPMAQADPGFWNYMGILQRDASAATLLPDSATGMPRTRGRESNMESLRRATDGGVVMTAVFRGFEDLALVPLARKSAYRILQEMPVEQWKEELLEFGKTFDESGSELTPEQLEWLGGSWETAANWSPFERWNKVAGEMEFEIRVFSTLGDRQRLIEQFTFFLQTISQIPEAMAVVDIPEFMRQIARAFDFSPSRVLKLPSAKTGNQPPQQGVGNQQDPKGHFYNGMTNDMGGAPPFVDGSTNPGL